MIFRFTNLILKTAPPLHYFAQLHPLCIFAPPNVSLLITSLFYTYRVKLLYWIFRFFISCHIYPPPPKRTLKYYTLTQGLPPFLMLYPFFPLTLVPVLYTPLNSTNSFVIHSLYRKDISNYHILIYVLISENSNLYTYVKCFCIIRFALEATFCVVTKYICTDSYYKSFQTFLKKVTFLFFCTVCMIVIIFLRPRILTYAFYSTINNRKLSYLKPILCIFIISSLYKISEQTMSKIPRNYRGSSGGRRNENRFNPIQGVLFIFILFQLLQYFYIKIANMLVTLSIMFYLGFIEYKWLR